MDPGPDTGCGFRPTVLLRANRGTSEVDGSTLQSRSPVPPKKNKSCREGLSIISSVVWLISNSAGHGFIS